MTQASASTDVASADNHAGQLVLFEARLARAEQAVNPEYNGRPGDAIQDLDLLVELGVEMGFDEDDLRNAMMGHRFSIAGVLITSLHREAEEIARLLAKERNATPPAQYAGHERARFKSARRTNIKVYEWLLGLNE